MSIKMLSKNGKLHIEGQTNERTCKCAHCGQRLIPNQGTKVIAYGTYKFVHEYCKVAYAVESETKNYKHDTIWIIEIMGRGAKYEGLKAQGWTQQDNYFVLATNTLNKLKSLKNIDKMTAKIEIITHGGYADTISYINTGYEALRNNIVLKTKKAISIDRYGYDKGNWSLHADFNNI